MVDHGNMEAHSLMLELCHQLGAKDGEDMTDMLFAAVRDARRYRWIRDTATFAALGATQVQGVALDHACDRGLKQNNPSDSPGSSVSTEGNLTPVRNPSHEHSGDIQGRQ